MTRIVTVDGPVASGKTSVSRELARKLSWNWVSTGVFYRGLAWVARKHSLDVKDEKGLVDFFKKMNWEVKLTEETSQFLYEGEDISESMRDLEVGALSSLIACLPEVRAFLLEPQRKVVEQAPRGLVAEGRDCGTIVFKHQAFLKFYITASSENRAERRFKEKDDTYQDVIKDQLSRDEREKTRAVAPLVKAEEAFLIDTTNMNLEEVVEVLSSMIQERLLK